MMKRTTAMALAGALCLAGFLVASSVERDRGAADLERAREQLDRMGAALGEGWIKQRQTSILPIPLRNDQGDEIIYYICQTVYEDGAAPPAAGLDPVLDQIIDPDTAEESRACTVSGLDAMLYRKEGRSYLCWTVSPEYSLAISYSGNVAEADIFKMAESVDLTE